MPSLKKLFIYFDVITKLKPKKMLANYINKKLFGRFIFQVT